MDKLSGLLNKAGGSSEQKPAAQGNNSTEDYGDKGLDFLEKKAGFSQSRDTNEKISDGAREQFEKLTGKDIPDKYSN